MRESAIQVAYLEDCTADFLLFRQNVARLKQDVAIIRVECLEDFREANLILLDISNNLGNAFDLLDDILAINNTAPIILTSGIHPTESMYANAPNAKGKIYSFIAKPIEASMLRAILPLAA